MQSTGSLWWITCWVGRRASDAVFVFLCSALPSACVPNLARSKCYKEGRGQIYACVIGVRFDWGRKCQWHHETTACALGQFVPALCIAWLCWKHFGKFKGQRTPQEVFVEGLKMQSSQFPSCMAILWSGDVLSCKQKECAQFLSVRRTKISKWQNTLVLFYLSICWQFFKQF